MAGDPRLIAARCPATVAVHYDRNMQWKPVCVYLMKQEFIDRATLDYAR
jgi:hypothetical protein